MSCRILDDKHIHYIVSFAVLHCSEMTQVRRYLAQPEEIGTLLIEENYRAHNDRYRQRNVPHEYKFKPYDGKNPLIPVNAIKAVICMQYQLADIHGLPNRTVKVFLEAIMHKAISLLDGYKTAPWEIEE